MKLYFISKAGFTDQAKELAKDNNILLLDGNKGEIEIVLICTRE